MADFMADSTVEFPDAGKPGRAVLSENWAVWGPNGGYLAAIALRSAIRCSRLSRPASFHCHFLAVGQFAPVALHVTSLGGGKRAESLRVEIVQEGRTLLSASVWMVDDELGGYTHDFGKAPEIPGPGDLAPYQELADNYDEWYPIWRSMEGRPLRFGHDEPGEPISQTWHRFDDTPIPDREADAVRQLFWLDFPGWNATISAHTWPFPFLTPNLDLMIQFHRFAPEAEWMLADGNVLVAGDGLVGCVSRLWTEDGRLLATGTSKHVCRPNPQYEEELARARAEGLRPEADA
ncbi:MAG: thioesterase family protein [Deltaproteobacteria bacterium]|nr:thioesterase family protein [Deltaproteobacteria bacterium]